MSNPECSQDSISFTFLRRPKIAHLLRCPPCPSPFQLPARSDFTAVWPVCHKGLIIYIDYFYNYGYFVPMEKRSPHHRLEEIQRMAADPESRPFTVTALRGGLALGLTESEMRRTVAGLDRGDFYKSMTTHADHRCWQDVYHGVTEGGIAVYVKVTACAEDRPPVIQFKAW